jgi:hypothetical protein
MRNDLALLVALAVVFPSCGGGGGGTTGPNPPPTTTLTPTTTTTLPSAGDPVLRISVSKAAGKQPLAVNFSTCDSRDATGGNNLRYFVDFADGAGLRATNCGFSHTFGSDGVTVYHVNFCAENTSGSPNRKCEERQIKTYVDVAISVDKNTGCASTVIASANLALGHNSFDVAAASQVDRVMFEAFSVAGNKLGDRDGQKQSNTEWRSGTWNVNNTEKVRVKATVFSKGVRGDDIPEADRPGC